MLCVCIVVDGAVCVCVVRWMVLCACSEVDGAMIEYYAVCVCVCEPTPAHQHENSVSVCVLCRQLLISMRVCVWAVCVHCVSVLCRHLLISMRARCLFAASCNACI